jgi:hypothetical protein
MVLCCIPLPASGHAVDGLLGESSCFPLGWASCPLLRGASSPLLGAIEGYMAGSKNSIKPAMRNNPNSRYPALSLSSASQFTLIMTALSFLSLLLATTAFAAPMLGLGAGAFQGACSVDLQSPILRNLPSPLDPELNVPNAVLMGLGVQNYTCNTAGTFE